jgi:intracellular septation protein
MGEAVNLPEAAWRTLTLRWGVFFLIIAGLNELIWRNVSTDMWINFKVFGLLGLTLVFALANAPYMAKHMIEDRPEPAEKPPA